MPIKLLSVLWLIIDWCSIFLCRFFSMYLIRCYCSTRYKFLIKSINFSLVPAYKHQINQGGFKKLYYTLFVTVEFLSLWRFSYKIIVEESSFMGWKMFKFLFIGEVICYHIIYHIFLSYTSDFPLILLVLCHLLI